MGLLVCHSAFLLETIIFCLLIVLPAPSSGQVSRVVQDSINGTIQLLNGLNELLEAGKDSNTPSTPLDTILSNTVPAMKGGIIDAATPAIEKLYDEFFNSNMTTDEAVNTTDSYTDAPATEEFAQQFQSTEANLEKIFTENASTFAPVAQESTVYSEVPIGETTTVYREIVTPETTNTTDINDLLNVTTPVQDNLREFYNTTSSNTTLDFILSAQDNVCYKLRSGIKSLSRSELVVLLMKFLEYDYLKAKEAWQRLKATSSRIWTAAVTDPEDEAKNTVGSQKVTQFMSFMEKIKNEIKYSLNILKVPFSTVMRGIKNKLKKSQTDESEAKDFCMKLNSAERSLANSVWELEQKLSRMLDTKLKEQNEFLQNVTSKELVLLDEETISKDMFFLKDYIYKIYDYLRTAATSQLDRLQGFVNGKKK